MAIRWRSASAATSKQSPSCWWRSPAGGRRRTWSTRKPPDSIIIWSSPRIPTSCDRCSRTSLPQPDLFAGHRLLVLVGTLARAAHRAAGLTMPGGTWTLRGGLGALTTLGGQALFEQCHEVDDI